MCHKNTHPLYSSCCFYTPCIHMHFCIVNMRQGTGTHCRQQYRNWKANCVDVRCVRWFSPQNSGSVPAISYRRAEHTHTRTNPQTSPHCCNHLCKLIRDAELLIPAILCFADSIIVEEKPLRLLWWQEKGKSLIIKGKCLQGNVWNNDSGLAVFRCLFRPFYRIQYVLNFL